MDTATNELLTAEETHRRRMHRIRNLTAFEDVSKEANDAVDAVLARFDNQPASAATFTLASHSVRAALMTLGFDCPFRIESNYVGGGVNNPRLIFLSRAQLRVMKALASACPDDFDAWSFVVERYGCDL
jgi:hypothetical protein